MFEKQKDVVFNVPIKLLWKFLINYNWSELVKGYSTVSHGDNKWLVQLENRPDSNIQIIEMIKGNDRYSFSVKITPKFNKHQSYDLLSLSLVSEKSRTLLKMEYGYYPQSISEKLFARILNKEDNIFEDYSNILFNDIKEELLTQIYG